MARGGGMSSNLWAAPMRMQQISEQLGSRKCRNVGFEIISAKL